MTLDLLDRVLAAVALHPDRALINDALRPAKAAQRMLERRLSPVIIAHLRRDARRAGAIPGQDIADLLGEVWVTLYKDDGRQLRAYDPQRASLEHYVGLIARRVAFNRRRGAHARPDLRPVPVDSQSPASAPAPDDAAMVRDLAERLRQRMRATLTPRGALIFVMLYEDGLTPAQVARALNIKGAVVHNWNSRIRKAARAFLDAQG